MAGVLLWLWNYETEEWEKAPGAVITARLVATGQVITGSHKLCWVLLNPSAANNAVELSDDIDGSTAIVLDAFKANRDSFFLRLDPSKQFDTGIYLKTFTNMTSVTFGYI